VISVTRKLVQEATGVSWHQIINIFKDEDEPETLREISDGEPLALRASHGNSFILNQHRLIGKIEGMTAIWHVLLEKDVHYVSRRNREGEFIQATYEEVPGTWHVTLESPVGIDGFPERGQFLRAFEEEFVTETTTTHRLPRRPKRRELFKSS